MKQWIEQVYNSGIDFPDFEPTYLPDDGSSACAANKEAAENDDRCWWTCGQCTREDDVSACPAKLTFGLSFDDGPSPWTPQLLDYLDQQNLKATFFVVGSRAAEYPEILRAEHMRGHQIAVHTWYVDRNLLIRDTGLKLLKVACGAYDAFERAVDRRVRLEYEGYS